MMDPSRLGLLARVAAEVGTPCFAYFLGDIRSRVALIRAEFRGRFAISYAVKSNPHPFLLGFMRDLVDGLDISSGGELARALAAGWPGADMSFTGPGKRTEELQAAVGARVGRIVVESVAEAERISSLAESVNPPQRVLVRIAPRSVPRGFGVNMAGKPTQFGIDEEDTPDAMARILALPHLRVAGLHAYSGTQCLDAAAVAENFSIFADVFRSICLRHELVPDELVFGSGFGIPYHEGTSALDLHDVAGRVNPLLDNLHADRCFRGTRFTLETGRYLVGESGIYLTSVVGIKRSRGATIAICDGGMNHHLGACGHLGSVIHRNYRILKVGGRGDAESVRHELVGPLCTSIDTLGHAVCLPALSVGDVIGIHCSGAYGPTASPGAFISHPPAREAAVEELPDGPNIVPLSPHCHPAAR